VVVVVCVGVGVGGVIVVEEIIVVRNVYRIKYI